MLHIVLHFLVPVSVVAIFYRPRWKQAIMILWACMLVDIDHLLATPVYDPLRCSINFHPLHSYWAIGAYTLLLIPKRSRLIAVGLLLHMGLDWQDCF